MPAPILINIALFAPIDYVALVVNHPEVNIEAHENYQKQTLRNRYYIGGPNGIQLLQVPVSKGGTNPCQLMSIQSDEGLPWRKSHVRALETAYNKSPWFLYYRDEIENLLLRGNTSLWECGLTALMVTAMLLKVKPNIDLSVEYIHQAHGVIDLRPVFGKKPNDKHQRIFPEPLPYAQVFSTKYGFQAGLSILDLLFNEGPVAREYLSHRYQQLMPFLQTLKKNIDDQPVI